MAFSVKGMRENMEAGGQLLIALGGCLLLVAVIVFGVKTWIQCYWPRANGTVVASSIETQTADDGTKMCSGFESVRYVVDGQDFTVKNGGHAFTIRCSDVETQVASARGQTRLLVYRKQSPGTAYLNPGFNLGFHNIDSVLTCAAGGFAVAGWVGVKLSQLMAQKGIVA